MADARVTITASWTKLTVNAVDLTNGTFVLTNIERKKYYFEATSSLPPTEEIGVTVMESWESEFARTLAADEVLWAKVVGKTGGILGVVTQ